MRYLPNGSDQGNPGTSIGEQKRKNMIMQSSLNLHGIGLHFVDNITGIEEIPAVDPELSEEEEQPLTDIRFRASGLEDGTIRPINPALIPYWARRTNRW